MKPPGPLLASGRDADVFAYGNGAVLRRSRQGRSLVLEAKTLDYLSAHGYPVPKVYEVSDAGLSLVMARIEGPTMVTDIARRPWTMRRAARELAALHLRLHELDAPDFVPDAPVGAGTKLLHMDLHPLNVMRGARGPVVIDWTGARAGDPSVDVVMAWVLMSAGELPQTGRIEAALRRWVRGTIVSTFVSCFERAPLVERLAEVVAYKGKDPHMRPSEVAAMWALVAREQPPAAPQG